MNLFEALGTARTMRRLLPDAVPEADLRRILWAATRAPSADNRQPTRWVVLAGASPAKELLGGAFRRGLEAQDLPPSPVARSLAHLADHFEATPVVVLACARPTGLPALFEGASVYPACQNFVLAARALGYGTVLSLCHLSVEAELKALLGIPDPSRVAATIALGRPAGRFGPVRRRPLERVVFDGAWDVPADWAEEETSL